MSFVEELVQILVAVILASMLAIIIFGVLNVLRLVESYETKLGKLRALELILVDRDRGDLKRCELIGKRIKMYYRDGKSVTYEVRYNLSTGSKSLYRVARAPGSRPGYNLVYEDGNAVSITSEVSGRIVVVSIDDLSVAFSVFP